MKEKVEAVITEIKKVLAQEGGSIELVEVVNGVVKVRLQGACSSCPMSQMTLKNFVEKTIKERVPGVDRVEAVK